VALMIGLGRRELELLEQLVEAERNAPGELFVAIYTSGGTLLRHMTSPQRDLGQPDVAALIGLADAGLLRVQRHQRRGPGSFYVPSGADQALEELRAQLGQPTPLSEALERVAVLEARHRRGEAARAMAARRFGRLVRWLVLPLALAGVALAAWLTAGPGAGVGVLIVVAVLYAIFTTGLGISGLQLAKAAEDGATRWAERRLAAWADPDPPS
jgi:hypothetical protein